MPPQTPCFDLPHKYVSSLTPSPPSPLHPPPHHHLYFQLALAIYVAHYDKHFIDDIISSADVIVTLKQGEIVHCDDDRDDSDDDDDGDGDGDDGDDDSDGD